MSDEREAPTLEEVGELEARGNDIRSRLGWLEARLAEITDGLAGLHAEARADAPEARTLRDERRALTDEQAELEAALPIVVAKAKETRDQALLAKATARMKAIQGAAGSQASHYEGDPARLSKAAKAWAKAVQKTNDRYEAILGYHAEAKALAARFDLTVPELPSVLPPSIIDEAEDAQGMVRGAKLSENIAYRIARYGPDPDSPGARLIAEAGPSEAELEAQAKAERAKETREAQEQAELERFEGLFEQAEAVGGGFRS